MRLAGERARRPFLRARPFSRIRLSEQAIRAEQIEEPEPPESAAAALKKPPTLERRSEPVEPPGNAIERIGIRAERNAIGIDALEACG